MSNPRAYDVGTITLTNGSTAFTGDDTAWLLSGVQYGTIVAVGLSAVIDEITTETAGTLMVPWDGPTYTGPYVIVRENTAAADVVDLYDRMTQALLTLSLAGIHPDGLGTIAQRNSYGDSLTALDKKIWLRAELGQPFEYYVWNGPTALSWLGPYPVAQTGTPGLGEGGYGLPLGGTTGQVPAKASGTDGDVEWVTPVSASAFREKLTANRTYYVRTDGSNSNTGLANTAGGAFLTIQGAYAAILAIDTAGFTVTIQVAAGTYTSGLTVSVPWTGGGQIILLGDEATPANVVVSSGSLANVSATLPAALNVRGFKHSGASQTFIHQGVGALRFRNIEFASTAFAQIQSANAGAKVWVDGNYSITAIGTYHMYVAQQGALQSGNGISPVVTLTGALAFSAFVTSQALGMIWVVGMTFTGTYTPTGARYTAATNGIINTNGGGASFFPGSTAGSVSTGGVYA